MIYIYSSMTHPDSSPKKQENNTDPVGPPDNNNGHLHAHESDHDDNNTDPAGPPGSWRRWEVFKIPPSSIWPSWPSQSSFVDSPPLSFCTSPFVCLEDSRLLCVHCESRIYKKDRKTKKFSRIDWTILHEFHKGFVHGRLDRGYWGVWRGRLGLFSLTDVRSTGCWEIRLE